MEIDREVNMFVEEMGLQDVSYNGAPCPSQYPAREGSKAPRIDAVLADPRCVRGMTVEYMVGLEEMQDTKGRCPMMVTVGVRVGGLGDNEEREQESNREGVNVPTSVRWPATKGEQTWQRCVPGAWAHEEGSASLWFQQAGRGDIVTNQTGC